MEKQNNITENLCFNCFPACQVHNAKIHGKQPRDETILPGTCHLGVYFIVSGKKKNFKDMENTVWENKTLPKACLLRVFEFLKYQNAETRLTNALW